MIKRHGDEMKRIVCIFLIVMLIISFAFLAEKNVSEKDAVRAVEKLAETMFTSDKDRFEEHKQTDFYVEDPTGMEIYGYESLFMYLPLYEEICTKNAIRDLIREEPFCVLTTDRYIDKTDYDKASLDKITYRVSESDDYYIIFFTAHVELWKGDVYVPKTFDFEAYVRKNDSEYDDGKAGQIDLIQYNDSFVFLDV